MARELHVFARNENYGVQFSNGYPNMISYTKMEGFSFQPVVPLRSNLGLERDPKLRKSGQRNTHIRPQSRLWCTTLKWVSNYDFIRGNKGFFFSTRNPTSFQLRPVT
jgi:hypothetical protein